MKRKILLYSGIALLFIAALLISYFRLLDNYELQTFDIRFRLRPQEPVRDDIVIIEIGDDSIDKLGKWPISRKFYAALIDALSEAGARSIVFDVFFSEESNPEADTALEEALKRSGRVYLPHVFDLGEVGQRVVPVANRLQEDILDRFEDDVKGVGFINIIPDTDGKFRRVPPFISFRGKLFPHVAFLVAADYLGIKRDSIEFVPQKYIKLGDGIKIPLDLNSSIIVNFPGLWIKTFRHYSFIDVIDSHMRGQFPAILGSRASLNLGDLKGAVCFIGVTATATPDAHPNSLEPLYPGVGVHTSLLNSILINKFIRRVGRMPNLFVLIFLGLCTFLISRRTVTLIGILLIVLFITGFIGVALLLFIFFGLWIDVFYPVGFVFLLYLGLTFLKYIAESHKRELIEKELGIAKKIQESFLPKKKPEVKGLELAAEMRTARQVGGDLYDFVEMGEEGMGIMIGDVSGKGVPAALYMAKVVSEFKSSLGEEGGQGFAAPRQVVTKLNDRLCKEATSGLFVTLSYIIFDKKRRVAAISSGGHLPLIVVNKNTRETRLVDIKEGTPLGLFEGDFGEESIGIKPGDLFILYTDGVTEAMNPKGEMFGEEKLVTLAKANCALPAEELTRLIQDEVGKFEGRMKQHDDITVVVIEAA
jgi:adenylate cyclase